MTETRRGFNLVKWFLLSQCVSSKIYKGHYGGIWFLVRGRVEEVQLVISIYDDKPTEGKIASEILPAHHQENHNTHSGLHAELCGSCVTLEPSVYLKLTRSMGVHCFTTI